MLKNDYADEELLDILDDHGHDGANGKNRKEANLATAKRIRDWSDRQMARVLKELYEKADRKMYPNGIEEDIAFELELVSPKAEKEKV